MTLKTTQAVLILPKHDELRATAAVFGFDATREWTTLDGRYSCWLAAVNGISLAIVCAAAQSSTRLALATTAALEAFEPSVAICLGTAAGRAGRTNYLDVILATAVLDATEWRAESGRFEPQWDDAMKPTREVLQDIDDFVKDTGWRSRCLETFGTSLELLGSPQAAPEGFPAVHDAWAVTTSFLHQDEEFLNQVWSLHARLRTIDMESAGFVSACTSGPRTRAWYVIRSVSDFGTRESKRDHLRPAAGAAAASVAKSLLESGLVRSHPLRLASAASAQSELSEGNFYTGLTMPEFIARKAREELRIVVDSRSLSADISITDLASLWAGTTGDRDVRAVLEQMREEYYTQKYLDYNDEADVRGHVGHAWVQDVADACEFIGIDRAQADVLYVGVGTGRDLDDVCPEFKSLTGVDVSREMLNKARLQQPAMSAVVNGAEALRGIPDSSTDLYLSLRTYQSSLFDISASLREAHRVIRPDGGIVLSISGGYVDRLEDGTLRFVPGILVPGSRAVDRSRPRVLAERVIEKLENLMFERIGFHQLDTDYYIYARRGLSPSA